MRAYRPAVLCPAAGGVCAVGIRCGLHEHLWMTGLSCRMPTDRHGSGMDAAAYVTIFCCVSAEKDRSRARIELADLHLNPFAGSDDGLRPVRIQARVRTNNAERARGES